MFFKIFKQNKKESIDKIETHITEDDKLTAFINNGSEKNLTHSQKTYKIDSDKTKNDDYIGFAKNNSDDNLSQTKEEIAFSEDEIESLIKKEAQKKILELSPHLELVNEEFHNNHCKDPLFFEAASLFVALQTASTSAIQRKFAIGYNRAGRIMNQLEHFGIISAATSNSILWTVLVKDAEELERILAIYSINEERDAFFKKNVLPSVLYRVEELVNKELEDKLKEQLKEEIIKEEKEKREKKRIKELKAQLRKELLQEGQIDKLESDSSSKRCPIPKDIQDRVWNRDNGKCVNCGNNEKLEFDHIIPFSKGGSNTYRNIQLLCEKCNRLKSNKIG